MFCAPLEHHTDALLSLEIVGKRIGASSVGARFTLYSAHGELSDPPMSNGLPALKDFEIEIVERSDDKVANDF